MEAHLPNVLCRLYAKGAIVQLFNERGLIFLDSYHPESKSAVQIKEAALELGYQADETFCLKISQLREIFVVRWSVFLLGPAGCGKSAIWKTLMRAQQNFGEKTFFKPINPKVSCSCSLSATCRLIKSTQS